MYCIVVLIYIALLYQIKNYKTKKIKKMKTKLNWKLADNIVRSFQVMVVLAAVPLLSYLTLTHNERDYQTAPVCKVSPINHVQNNS